MYGGCVGPPAFRLVTYIYIICIFFFNGLGGEDSELGDSGSLSVAPMKRRDSYCS